MPQPRDPKTKAEQSAAAPAETQAAAPTTKYVLAGLAVALVVGAYLALNMRPGDRRPETEKSSPASKGAQAGLIAAPRDKHVLGRWCGSESSYVIGKEKMAVTRHSDSAQLEFDVTAMEPRGGSLSVSWRRADGKVVRTEFTEFSADGLRMVQLSNSGGPRREFKRC